MATIPRLSDRELFRRVNFSVTAAQSPEKIPSVDSSSPERQQVLKNCFGSTRAKSFRMGEQLERVSHFSKQHRNSTQKPETLPCGRGLRRAAPQEDISIVSISFVTRTEQTPIKGSRREPIRFKNIGEKDAGGNCIEGGLKGGEALEEGQRERKAVRASLRLRITEDQPVSCHRRSLPESIANSPHGTKTQAARDISPMLTGSTEDQETSYLPLSEFHAENVRKQVSERKQARDAPRVAAFFKRQFHHKSEMSASPRRGDMDIRLNLDSAGHSKFLHPSVEREMSPGLDEIDRFILQHEAPSPGKLSEESPVLPESGLSHDKNRGMRSFPRHVFKARSYWKSARPMM